MFKDSYRSTISFNQAAFYTILLIEKYKEKFLGAINVCGDEHLSKYNVALKIAEKFSFNKKLVIPVSIKNSDFNKNRAASTLLNNTKLKTLLNINSIELQISE
jgi:dTDP-4-dehydrorhamnose reductase